MVALNAPDEHTFLNLPDDAIRELVEPRDLSISLLLNGTRRWYISKYFDAPPRDNSYLPHYLETVLVNFTSLLDMLAAHGLKRMFVPVYSAEQGKREQAAHKFLIKGIEALIRHPALLKGYNERRIAVRFYGDSSYITDELDRRLLRPLNPTSGEPAHTVYYDVNSGNPYDYLLKLAFDFGLRHGRPPTWEDMVEMYYGDRSLRRLDILIAFNRMYSRIGLPTLLEGNDRIYLTVVSPLVLSQRALRRILYDYLYNHQDPGRNYTELHRNELVRLKQFYASNSETVVGLTKKFEDLCYPLPSVVWPETMEQDAEPHGELN